MKTEKPIVRYCRVSNCTNLAETKQGYCRECADEIAWDTYWDMKEMERRGE